MPVGAASTLPGALAVLSRTAEPDVLVTHDEDRFDFSSETLQVSVMFEASEGWQELETDNTIASARIV